MWLTTLVIIHPILVLYQLLNILGLPWLKTEDSANSIWTVVKSRAVHIFMVTCLLNSYSWVDAWISAVGTFYTSDCGSNLLSKVISTVFPVFPKFALIPFWKYQNLLSCLACHGLSDSICQLSWCFSSFRNLKNFTL